jgi:hypothetical protein
LRLAWPVILITIGLVVIGLGMVGSGRAGMDSDPPNKAMEVEALPEGGGV